MIKRKEFIELLAQKGYTKTDAETVTDDVIATIMEILVGGNDVMFHGFGTFSVKAHKGRTGVNPRTAESIQIPAYKTPKFTAGKLLKRSVKEGHIRR